MTAPSIQLAPSMSTENIAASVHAFETGVGTGLSFAEHLDRAVQSSPRPASRAETQASDMRSTTPKQASDATQTPRRQATTTRPTASQTKQNSGAGSNTNGKARTSDPMQKDEQRQPSDARGRDSRPSDSSRNSGGRQAGDKETSAKGKGPFAQAVAQSAASQQAASEISSTAQSGEAQPADASLPAALLALLQAAQGPAQAVAAPASGNDPDAVQADSSSTDADPATPSNPFQSLNFSTSNAAYQAALMNFQTSAPAAQSTSGNGIASASQPSTPASGANFLPSADQQTSASGTDSQAAATGSSASTSQTTPAVSTDSMANSVGVTPSASPAANAGSMTSTAAPVSQVNAAMNAAHALPATNGQQQTGTQLAPTSLIKDLKSDAGQHEAPKPPLEALTAAGKPKAEPVAAELQQAVTSVTVTNHASSPALSRQACATDFQSLTAGQDSGSSAVSGTQGSASGWTGDSTGDSAGDDSSTQAGSSSQGSNSSKSSGTALEFLPSSAFNNDAVSGVAPTAVHAVAAGTLQSSTGFDNAPVKTPEAVPQNLNTAAQEKAFAAWQSVSAQIGRVVNTATLNALQNGTEMRVQLRTDAFGSMDIRATLEGGKVGAAIGVESAEAHNALLSQLPALQQSLNERQVQLDQISVVSSYGQSGTDFGAGSGRQNGDPTPSSGYHQQASGSEQMSEPASTPVTETWQPATSRGRLSVQA